MNRFLADLGDDLDELLTSPVAPAGERKAPPAHYQPPSFDEPCPKCRGRGRFISYGGRDCGPCFTCKGKGKRTFATAPEKRAQSRQAAAERRERVPQENWEGFAAAHPEVAAWILESQERFGFALSMKQAVERYGSLTVNQLAACERSIQSRAKAVAARAERQTAAPKVEVARIEAAFATARENDIKKPKLRLGDFVFKPAKPDSKWFGSIYIYDRNRAYLGRVTNGQLFAIRECTEEQRTEIIALCADPAQAAKAYGFRTICCACCGAELTNAESRERGIGPICASKWGF